MENSFPKRRYMMYRASEKNLTSYMLIVKPKKESFIKKLPSAFSVFQSLKYMTIQSEIAISDMLPDCYLYKPVVLDMANLNSEKQFLQYKRIKKVKYIHKDLFANCFFPESIIRGVECGDIRIIEQFMRPALVNDRFICKKQFIPDYNPPIVYRLTETDLFNILVRSEKKVINGFAQLQHLSIDGTEYVIEDIQQMKLHSSGGLMVLQASGTISSNYHVSNDLRGAFKLGWEQTDKTQFFKAGSILDDEIILKAIQDTGFTPFAMYGGTRQ